MCVQAPGIVSGQSRIAIKEALHTALPKDRTRRSSRDTVAGRDWTVSHPVYATQRIPEMAPGGNANNAACKKSSPPVEPFNLVITASFRSRVV